MGALSWLARGQDRWLGIGAFALVGGSAVALTTFALGTGSILVDVTAKDASRVPPFQLFVDERQVDCEGTPCVVSAQEPGPHLVKLIGDGFALPQAQVARVSRHESSRVSFVIEPMPSFGLKISGTQPDLTLFVDQKEIGKLPRQIELAPGPHWIRVSGAEFYQPFERQIELDPAQLTLLAVTLKVLEGRVKIFPGPITGARLFLEGSSGRQELPSADPALGYVTINVDARQSWSIVATKDGYPTYKQAISFEDGEREKTYTVTFTRANIIDDSALVSTPLSQYLSGERVQQTVARYTGSVKRACWQSALDTRERDAPTTARVNVTITVLPSGSVETATGGDDPRGYKGLSACVTSRVRGWQFPPAGGATTIHIPFVFAAQ